MIPAPWRPVLGDGTNLRDGRIPGLALNTVVATRHACRLLTSQNTLTRSDARGLLRGGGNAWQGATRLRSHESPFQHRKAIAGNFYVDIVLERECDGILGGQVELTGSDQIRE